jgi:elongation factor Ts
VAACPDVTVVSKDDVPEDVVAKEREIEMGKQDILEKPEQARYLFI